MPLAIAKQSRGWAPATKRLLEVREKALHCMLASHPPWCQIEWMSFIGWPVDTCLAAHPHCIRLLILTAPYHTSPYLTAPVSLETRKPGNPETKRLAYTTPERVSRDSTLAPNTSTPPSDTRMQDYFLWSTPSITWSPFTGIWGQTWPSDPGEEPAKGPTSCNRFLKCWNENCWGSCCITTGQIAT